MKFRSEVRRMYMRGLRAIARGLIVWGYQLEDHSIRIELEIEDESKDTTRPG